MNRLTVELVGGPSDGKRYTVEHWSYWWHVLTSPTPYGYIEDEGRLRPTRLDGEGAYRPRKPEACTADGAILLDYEEMVDV